MHRQVRSNPVQENICRDALAGMGVRRLNRAIVHQNLSMPTLDMLRPSTASYPASDVDGDVACVYRAEASPLQPCIFFLWLSILPASSALCRG
jgi:hypothetical protein